METSFFYQEVVRVAKLRSHIPDLIAAKGWSPNVFIGLCIQNGISMDTAKKMVNGKTNLSNDTLSVAASVLGVSSIAQLIDFNNGH
jgi:hypothetical protein